MSYFKEIKENLRDIAKEFNELFPLLNTKVKNQWYLKRKLWKTKHYVDKFRKQTIDIYRLTSDTLKFIGMIEVHFEHHVLMSIEDFRIIQMKFEEEFKKT